MCCLVDDELREEELWENAVDNLIESKVLTREDGDILELAEYYDPPEGDRIEDEEWDNIDIDRYKRIWDLTYDERERLFGDPNE